MFYTSRITIIQALYAMKKKLEMEYYKTFSDDLGAFLSGLLILNDGGTADPACMDDWIDTIKFISKSDTCPDVITFDQAYEAMVKFLDDYATLTNSKDLKLLLSDMHKSNDGDNWNEIVSQVVSKPITPDFVLYKP